LLGLSHDYIISDEMKSGDAMGETVERLRLWEFLPYRLSVASEKVSQLFAARYAERFGLAIPEWRVLAILGEAATPCSTQEVIRRTAMDRVRVSRAVIRLADRGLIARRPVPGDQRAQRLALSAKGRAMYAQIVPLAQALQAELAGALSAAEQATLVALLERLGARAEALR
jgi:DNA-binding MarR family transcriptional regulator